MMKSLVSKPHLMFPSTSRFVDLVHAARRQLGGWHILHRRFHPTAGSHGPKAHVSYAVTETME